MFESLLALIPPLMGAAGAILAAALASPAPVALAAETRPGYDRLEVKADHRAGLVAASVWYPSAGGGNPGLVGDNPVFHGTPVAVGAAIAEGRFPLVLLSHGSGGNMDGLGWLSAALADSGAMVLAVNHPGSTSGDSSARRSVDLAAREADLSAALDALLADPAFAPHVDTTRIASAGFSLGGATALNLAGFVADRSEFAAYCDRLKGPLQDCDWFRRGGVDPANLPASFSATRGDARVSAVIAVDPALGDTYTAESLAAFKGRALFVNLGGDGDRWRAVDVGPTGSDLAGRLAGAALVTLSPAWHFSFLGLCKPDAVRILEEERDDPVCTDPAGSDRAAVHRQAAEAIAAFVTGLTP